MAKSKQRQSLRGAVLIMVLTVMFVLIIMLMATLTVVTTAGQRVYTKYEENQAYYSARSALDVFTQNMLSDATYYANDGSNVIKYSYTGKDSVTGADKIFTGASDGADMTQGLALQGELYKIKSQCVESKKLIEEIKNDTGHSLNSLVSGMTATEAENPIGFLENMLISDKVFGEDISSTIRPENEFYSIDPDTTSITYKVTLPKTGNGSNQYGLMVDEDPTTGVQVATITVEVLDRVYDTGGVYGREAAIKILEEYSNDKTDPDKQKAYEGLKTAISKGDRKNDDMTLKITSTVNLLGTEGTAVLIYRTQKPPVINTSRAITTFGGVQLKNMNIVGGVSTNDPVNWDNQGSIYGAIYAQNQWNNMSLSPQIYLTDSECYYIGGDVTADDSGFKVKAYELSSTTDKNIRPFVFVDGAFKVSNSAIGGVSNLDSEKVDLIVNGSIGGGSNNFVVNGDVYCKGSIDISTYNRFEINGDLYLDGALTISGSNHGWSFEDDTLLLPGGNPTRVHLSSTSSINETPVSLVKGLPAATPFTGLNFTNDTNLKTPDIDIVLPSGAKKAITTYNSIYSQYYTTDASGNLVIITPEQKYYGFEETKAFNTADLKTTATLSCSNNKGPVLLNGTPIANQIDTAGGVLKYKLSSGCGSTNLYGGEGGSDSYLYVSGGGTLELLLEPGVYWGNIVVADDTTLVMFGPSGSYQMDKFTVWTETVFNAYKNSQVLDVGIKGDNLKIPKIYYYFSDGAVISGENAFFMTGYFYGPGAEFNAIYQKYDIRMEYNDKDIGSVGVSFVGSVLCKDLKYDNALGGVAYINPNNNDDVKGMPNLAWTPVQYSRN